MKASRDMLTDDPSDPLVNVQQTPVVLVDDAGECARLKVDLAVVRAEGLIVSGWRWGKVELKLRDAGGAEIEVRSVSFPRRDVAAHFSRPADEALGFALIADDAMDEQPVVLAWRAGDAAWTEQTLVIGPPEEMDKHPDLLGIIGGVAARQHVPSTIQWKRRVASLPLSVPSLQVAQGHLESAVAFPSGKLIVVGWGVAEPGAELWIEDDLGGIHLLSDASWRERPDVHAAVRSAGYGPEALRSGFILRCHAQGKPGQVRLKALTAQGAHLLAELHCQQMHTDPVAASQWLFGIPVTGGDLHERFEQINGPVIESLITQEQASWQHLPVSVKTLGTPPADPTISIIVPLYGRFDFVESQMLEWVRDAWMRQHAELVYVIDDPGLVDTFRSHAEALYRLYGIPFRWVWGGANRGFSGANNLGVAHAAGKYLLFLNSDVFPQQPGWIETMASILDDDPDAGVVGARLTFAEGGIQHAGMTFEWSGEYGVWINQHPFLGLDTSLDPHHEAVEVAAVTGACMLMRRCDFESVGGWDTGYLIGDFEDSDLCLKVRAAGKRVIYQPRAQLTHLERQSIKELGSGDFRMQVTLWNAFRHQQRWRGLIEASVNQRAGMQA